MSIGTILASGGNPHVYSTPVSHTEWVMVDCEKAKEFLAFNTFDNQRKIRDQKVDNYAHQKRNGDWKPGADGGIQIARTGTGVWELMNGQHRLHATIKAGVTIPYLVTWYTFASETDKYAFFASVDQGAKRSESDALLALGIQSSLTGVHKVGIRCATAAIKAIELGFKAKGGNKDGTNPNTNTIAGTKRVLDAFSDPILATFNALMGNRAMSTKAFNSACFGVALLSFAYAPEEAQEFWPEIIDPNTLTKGTPQYALHHYLLTHTASEEVDSYVYCIANAWNAFAEGRGIDLLKRGSSQVILRVACTPMDGKNANAGREIIASRLASHGGQKS
jgi:hypothetical protein